MTSPFKEALREELRAAAVRDLARQTRRRRLRAAAGAAIAAVAAAVGAVTFVGTSPAAADIEVTIRNGQVAVRILDLATTPDEVREAMEEAGLAVDVDGAPVGPSMVGRFIDVRLEIPGDNRIEQLGSDGNSFDGFIIPENWDGDLEIRVGEKADPGEPYAAGADAFADGEPLHCLPLIGRTLNDVRDGLPDLNIMVRGPGGKPVSLDSPAADEFATWFVTGGRAVSATDVFLQVDPQAPTTPAPEC